MDLPSGASHHTLETVLGMDDLSMPEGYPISVRQVRAVLDYFDALADTAGPLDDGNFGYFISAFADQGSTKPDSSPSAQRNATDGCNHSPEGFMLHPRRLAATETWSAARRMRLPAAT